MSRPVFMIAIEPPGNAAPGMMTGRLEIDHAGRLVPDLVPRTPEFDWPKAAFKAPTVQIASRVMILLAEYGRANQHLRLVEFHPAEEAS